MCPNCRAFITTNDKVCPYCETKVGPRAIDLRGPQDVLGGFISADRFTTLILLTVNFGLYAATMLYSKNSGNPRWLTDIDGYTLLYFGAKLRNLIFAGQWWRLLTAGYLHGGLIHFLLNAWALLDLGPLIEHIYGTRRWIIIYTSATAGGFLASALWSPSLSIGASAGIFGLIGAMIAYGVHSRSALAQDLKSHGIRMVIYGLVIGILGWFPIDNAAHLGGAAGGFLAAMLTGTPRILDDWREKLWRVVAGLCLAGTALAFVEMFLAFSRMGSR